VFEEFGYYTISGRCPKCPSQPPKGHFPPAMSRTHSPSFEAKATLAAVRSDSASAEFAGLPMIRFYPF